MTIFFDLDGTIANLYSVPNWLLKLRNSDVSPYEEAAPLFRLNNIARLLNTLQKNGIRIGVITWLSKNSNPAYDRAVRRAKRRWLARHLGGYGMKILKENNINVNSISLADGQLLYIPNNTVVETVKGKFVED